MKQIFLTIAIFWTVSSFSYCIAGKKLQKIDKNEYHSLFSTDKDTIFWMSSSSSFFPKQGWTFENGELKLMPGQKGGDLITRKQYSDFELQLEFKLTKRCNSGVKYFLNQMADRTNGKIGWIGFEYQIIDDFNGHEISGYEGVKDSTGSLYLIYAPDAKRKKLNPTGQWNSLRIVVNGKHIEHWLNGKKIVNVSIDSEDFAKRVSQTKFANYEDYGKMSKGHILLQDHGGGISFRNILIIDKSKQ